MATTFSGTSAVVHDDVRLLQDALGAQRQQVRRARSGADQPHEAVVGGVGLGEQPRGEPARFVGTARQRGIGDAALEKGRPEAPARLALRQDAIGGGAEGIAEAAPAGPAFAGSIASMRARSFCASTGPAPVEVIATATGARLTMAGV